MGWQLDVLPVTCGLHGCDVPEVAEGAYLGMMSGSDWSSAILASAISQSRRAALEHPWLTFTWCSSPAISTRPRTALPKYQARDASGVADGGAGGWSRSDQGREEVGTASRQPGRRGSCDLCFSSLATHFPAFSEREP